MSDHVSEPSQRLYWEIGVAAGVAVLIGLVFLWPVKPAPAIDKAVMAEMTRARMLRGSGEVELALVALGKVLGVDAASYDANFELAEILRDRGRLDAARAAYETALAARETAAGHIGLGLVGLKKNEPDRAIAAFRRATELDPASAVAHLDLGIALLNANRAKEAIPVCARAVELAPDNLDARHNLGFAYRVSGQAADAVATLREVIASDPNRTITLYELASAEADAGEVEKARATFAALLALEPNHGAARSRLAELGPR